MLCPAQNSRGNIYAYVALYRNSQGCCSNKMSPTLSTDHCILDGQVVGFSHLSPITSFVYSIVIYTLTFMPH